ncbi:hypothetical protein ACH419_26610 [Streptomyces bobili]|uniref:hypothetical protein n=1 Tax=Streptomyces bobili TaxID=67280 RepID=UPI003794866A
MSRAVTPVKKARKGVAESHADRERGDPPREQLVKYFPLETSATYLATSAIIVQGTKADTTPRTIWLLVVFVVLLFVTLVDLLQLYPGNEYRRRWAPVAIGIGAYVIWAYGMVSLADELGIFNGVAAAVLAALYLVVAARVVPEKA